MTDLRQIGNYSIERPLGSGGMGTVYLATDLTLQRPVALKVMRGELAGRSDFRERFLQEARAAARLSHPSVAVIYQFEAQGDLMYIAMEYVPGGTLAACMQQGAIDLRDSLWVLAQVADALDYAHASGVIHRDIKPANILLRRLSRPERTGAPPLRAVVTDFGLAKLLEGGLQTTAGAFMGTLPYMSPEQCLSKPIDGRSDVYSLGVVLYQIATGQLPLEIQTPTDAVMKHLYATPPAPRAIRPGLPPVIEAIILQALAREPADRFATAGEMAEALRAAAAELTDDTVVAAAGGGTPVGLATLLDQRTGDEGARPEPEFGPAPPDLAQDRIQVLAANGAARYVPLRSGTMTLGRGPENAIVLDAPNVSRQHARIEFDGKACRVTDLRSTNGTFLGDARLLPDVPQEWKPQEPLRVGDFWLRIERGHRAERKTTILDTHGKPVDEEMISQSSDRQVAVALEAARLTVDPGGSVEASVIVLNQGQRVDHFLVSVAGISAAWLPAMLPEVQLMPGEQRTLTLEIQPPRAPQSRAGDYPLTIRVASRAAPDQVAEARATLTVGAYRQFSTELAPQQLRDGASGEVSVENQGNVDETFSLRWSDPANELDFRPAQARMTVLAGRHSATTYSVALRRRRWFGAAQSHPFTIHVALPEGEARTLSGQVVSRGLIPAWALPLLLILALALAYLLRGSPSPGPGPAPTKPPAPTALPTSVPPAPTAPPTRVTPPPAIVVEAWSVTPAEVRWGQPVTISWKVLNADKVELLPFGEVSPSGSRQDTPKQDQTYTLIATNARGETKVTASVHVRLPITERNAAALKVTLELVQKGEPRGLAFSPDSTTLAVVDRQGNVLLWRLPDGVLLRSLVAQGRRPAGLLTVAARVLPAAAAPLPGGECSEPEFPLRVAYSADGSLLAAGSPDGRPRVWRTSDGAEIRLVPAGDAVGPVAFSASASQPLLAAGTKSSLKVWDLAASDNRAEMPMPSPVTGVAFSRRSEGSFVYARPDGNALGLVAVSRSKPDGHLTLGTGPQRGDPRPITIAYSPDGTTLAVGAGDAAIRLYAADSLQPLRTLATGVCPGASLAFSPDGTLLSTTVAANALRLLRVADGATVADISLAGRIDDVAFSPDGVFLAATGAQGIVSLMEAR